MNFGFGARNAAMGNSASTFADDASALYFNPALLSNLSRPEIMFTHTQWIQDTRSEMLGAFARIWNVPIAIGINTTQISDIEVRTRPGEPETKFNVNYFSGSISSGFNLTQDLSLGVSIKYLYENLLSDEAMGVGYDFGAAYKLPFKGLHASTTFRNLGSMNTLRNEKTELPQNFTLGIAYINPVERFNSKIVFSAEYQNYTNSSESSINFGGEVLYNQLIALRMGYRINEFESRDFSLGLGLMWNMFYFDYAYVPFTENLGQSNIISIKIKF